MQDQQFWVFPQIDPVIFEIGPLLGIGPLAVRWYGLMYLVGFIAAFLLAKQRLAMVGWNKDQLSDFLFWGFIGVIIGGRIGYVLFYQFEYFLTDPLYLIKIWTGGMSFHGGLLGVTTAIWLYARKMQMHFLTLGDFVAPLVPIGLGAGRLGNFINAELWGRETDVAWGVIFPGQAVARHASQLYEFALEGVVLFLILWFLSKTQKPRGVIGGTFLLGYGAFRFFVEYFREPDDHLGLYSFGFSQGQLLCVPMILLGLLLIVSGYKKGLYDTPKDVKKA